MEDRRVSVVAVTVERRRRGRPRISDESNERLDIRLPLSVYDALCRDALRRGIPVATLARRIIAQRLSVGNKSSASDSSLTL